MGDKKKAWTQKQQKNPPKPLSMATHKKMHKAQKMKTETKTKTKTKEKETTAVKKRAKRNQDKLCVEGLPG
jgi:hypothetical protein